MTPIGIQGEVHFTLRSNGVETLVFRSRNPITNGGLNLVASLLKDGTGSAVSEIGFGEGSSTPAGSNTALTNAYTKAVGSMYISGGELHVPFTLDRAEANGKTVRELGLFCGATLIARKKLTSAVAKTDADELSGEWVLGFVRV